MITFDIPKEFYSSECVQSIAFDSQSKLISVIYRNYQHYQYTYVVSNESEYDPSFNDILKEIVYCGYQNHLDANLYSIGSYINYLMKNEYIRLLCKNKVE